MEWRTVRVMGKWSSRLVGVRRLRGEKLNYKSVAKEISKPPFLAPEVLWALKVYRVLAKCIVIF